MEASDRRAQIKAARIAETGIDDAMIEKVVRAFYARIREHEVLGPVFNSRIDDWEFHMRRLCAFWSSVLHASGAYGGSPMQKHVGLPIDGRHFDMWLALFEDTVRAVCAPEAAELFMERARRIAESLELGIAGHNRVLLFNGERLRRPDADVFLP